MKADGGGAQRACKALSGRSGAQLSATPTPTAAATSSAARAQANAYETVREPLMVSRTDRVRAAAR